MCISFTERHCVGHFDLDRLAVDDEIEVTLLAASREEVVDGNMSFEVFQRLWLPVGLQVPRSGAGDEPARPDPSRDEAEILQRTPANDAVDSILDQIDGSVARSNCQLDVRVPLFEGGPRR